MTSLPSAQTPLNQHSLIAFEAWLQSLGAERSKRDLCSWILLMPSWSAVIQLEQEELRVTWEKEGLTNQRCFNYGLPRSDIEAAIKDGP